MSLIDRLEAEPPVRTGYLCTFQRLREERGDDAVLEMLQVVTHPGYGPTRKQQVLATVDVYVSLNFIYRHGLNQCVRCRQWVS